MKCMVETVVELEKTKKKGGGSKSKGSKKGETQPFYPKKLVIANKKDLKLKNKSDGVKEEDMKEMGQLGITNIKFVSALNNQDIHTAFMKIVNELH